MKKILLTIVSAYLFASVVVGSVFGLFSYMVVNNCPHNPLYCIGYCIFHFITHGTVIEIAVLGFKNAFGW